MNQLNLTTGANAPNSGRDACVSQNTVRDAARHVSTTRPLTGGFIPLLWTRIFLSLMLFVFAMPMVKAQDEYFPSGNGDGTMDKPFQITSAADLATLAELVNTVTTKPEDAPEDWVDPTTFYKSASYKLMNDIDLGGKKDDEDPGWTPIGTGDNAKAFLGVFDGDGKKIIGLYINQEGGNKGLFGRINGTAAVIRNLGVVGDVTNTAFSGAAYSEMVGGIVGSVQGGGLIENCWFSGSVTGRKGTIGGITGYLNPGTINKCWTDATVKSNENQNNGRLGGIAGSMESTGSTILSVINNCYFSGTVIAFASAERTGGIVGASNPGRVSNCYVSGDVEGGAYGTGGIIGFVQANTIVENCYITGKVSEQDAPRQGGIVGRANGATVNLTIRNCIVLSLQIKGNDNNTARIHGELSSGAGYTYVNNYAWDGVQNYNGDSGATGWGPDRLKTNRQGEDATVAQIRAPGFFKDIFEAPITDPDGADKWASVTFFADTWNAALESAWSYPGGRLPNLLGETVPTPAHLNYTGDVVAPVITVQPTPNPAVEIGGDLTLSVVATSSDDGGLIYQWYRNTTASNQGGTAIEGAINASFDPDTEVPGTYYYYVVVTNGYVNSDGIAGKSLASNVSTVTVTGDTIYQLTISVSPSGVNATPSGAGGYLEATTVTINAGTEPKGYDFIEWRVDAGGVTLANPTDITTTFAMPGNHVTLTAVFDRISASEELKASSLKAWIGNGVLNVSGLTKGKIWKMYGISGAIVQQGVAGDDPTTISITSVPAGIYILQSEGQTVKIVIN